MPAGWWCTLPDGHDGPCPARREVEFRRVRTASLWFDVCSACGCVVHDNLRHVEWHMAVDG